MSACQSSVSEGSRALELATGTYLGLSMPNVYTLLIVEGEADTISPETKSPLIKKKSRLPNFPSVRGLKGLFKPSAGGLGPLPEIGESQNIPQSPGAKQEVYKVFDTPSELGSAPGRAALSTPVPVFDPPSAFDFGILDGKILPSSAPVGESATLPTNPRFVHRRRDFLAARYIIYKAADMRMEPKLSIASMTEADFKSIADAGINFHSKVPSIKASSRKVLRAAFVKMDGGEAEISRKVSQIYAALYIHPLTKLLYEIGESQGAQPSTRTQDEYEGALNSLCAGVESPALLESLTTSSPNIPGTRKKSQHTLRTRDVGSTNDSGRSPGAAARESQNNLGLGIDRSINPRMKFDAAKAELRNSMVEFSDKNGENARHETAPISSENSTRLYQTQQEAGNGAVSAMDPVPTSHAQETPLIESDIGHAEGSERNSWETIETVKESNGARDFGPKHEILSKFSSESSTAETVRDHHSELFNSASSVTQLGTSPPWRVDGGRAPLRDDCSSVYSQDNHPELGHTTNYESQVAHTCFGRSVDPPHEKVSLHAVNHSGLKSPGLNRTDAISARLGAIREQREKEISQQRHPAYRSREFEGGNAHSGHKDSHEDVFGCSPTTSNYRFDSGNVSAGEEGFLVRPSKQGASSMAVHMLSSNLEYEVDKTIQQWKQRASSPLKQEHSQLAQSETLETLRSEVGLEPASLSRHGQQDHPLHPYAWSYIKIMCRGCHNPRFTLPDIPTKQPEKIGARDVSSSSNSSSPGKNLMKAKRCANCGTYCCHYANLVASQSILTGNDVHLQLVRSQTQARASLLRQKYPKGIEEFETFLGCSHCGSKICPKCAEICHREGCQSVICTDCSVSFDVCPEHNFV